MRTTPAALFRAWKNAAERVRWMGRAPLVIRAATPSKRLRITWATGKTDLLVTLTARPAGRARIEVEHSRLKDAKAAAGMKAAWARCLEELRAHVEG